jgi:hypothetical protein
MRHGVFQSSRGLRRNGAVTGRWSYEATQEVPVRAQISGSMVISSANCVDFQGVLDAVEMLATGESRRVGGRVSGTIVAASLIRFEAVVGDGTREHIARLAADSLTGEWYSRQAQFRKRTFRR